MRSVQALEESPAIPKLGTLFAVLIKEESISQTLGVRSEVLRLSKDSSFVGKRDVVLAPNLLKKVVRDKL